MVQSGWRRWRLWFIMERSQRAARILWVQRACTECSAPRLPPAQFNPTNHRPCGIKNDFNYLLDPPPWQKSDRGPLLSKLCPACELCERIRMSGTGPRSGRTMSEFRHNLIITVSDQNQNCKGTQSMITNSLCIPIISNFHHWFLDSHQNFSWELFLREKDGGCARGFWVQKFSVLRFSCKKGPLESFYD